MSKKILIFLGLVFFFASQAKAESCVTAECHADVVSYKVMHAPVEAEDCTTCHIANDTYEEHVKEPKKFKSFSSPTEDGESVCMMCHDDVASKEFKHEPLEGCTDCHSPHGSAYASLLNTQTQAETCFMCHEDTQNIKEYVHGPVGAGECATCHNPHSSDHELLLRESTNNLCFICHSDKEADLDKHSVHPPTAENCTLCHDPHNSDAKFYLKAKDEKDLCLTCHGDMDPEFKDNILHAEYQHPPVQQGTCGECHNPHASDFGQLLRSETKQLCFQCHEAVGTTIKLSEYVHAPVESDGCNACHNVHGANNPFVLYEHFPTTFYNQYTEGMYKLCYECHDTSNLDSEFTKDGTNFRNGEQNLHYLHVMIPGKGRSCKACHEVHASEQPLHIRSEVPFGSGGWQLPINFTQTEEGGSCVVGCHKPKTYDRKKEFVNP